MTPQPLFQISRTRAKKYWCVIGPGRSLRLPRIMQMWRAAGCALKGHGWTEWSCDDYEGPMDGPIPLLSRVATDQDAFAFRACLRGCGAVEMRRKL